MPEARTNELCPPPGLAPAGPLWAAAARTLTKDSTQNAGGCHDEMPPRVLPMGHWLPSRAHRAKKQQPFSSLRGVIRKFSFEAQEKETLVWSSPSISVAAKLLKFASLNIFRNADASESITGLEINQSDLFL